MNKGLRNELENRQWARNLRRRGIPLDYIKKFHCFKAQRKPCSCLFCRPPKYKREKFRAE